MRIKSSLKEYEVYISNNFAPVNALQISEKDFIVVDKMCISYITESYLQEYRKSRCW